MYNKANDPGRAENEYKHLCGICGCCEIHLYSRYDLPSDRRIYCIICDHCGSVLRHYFIPLECYDPISEDHTFKREFSQAIQSGLIIERKDKFLPDLVL